jgi:hypothetical protein
VQDGHDATHVNPNGHRITVLTVGRLDRRTGGEGERGTLLYRMR